jgi:hypothetical protein
MPAFSTPAPRQLCLIAQLDADLALARGHAA